MGSETAEGASRAEDWVMAETASQELSWETSGSTGGWRWFSGDWPRSRTRVSL